MGRYEQFSDEQIQILSRYVTNTTSNVFVLHNLPEVIKGAVFSRYSRSTLGLRSLLLKEFILSDETAFSTLALPTESQEQFVAVKKAQSFYDRILDGYGDDSIGELGGAHMAIENLSMIAAKTIEDCRIGGSPLEKSTRYVYFDQKHNGEYLFYKEPILMTSAYRDLYLKTCNHLFDTYSKLVPPLTALMEKKFPKQDEVSSGAYTAALRAKVLDCLRGLLPAGTLTNMGLFGNGRFFEGLLQKLNCHNLAEAQELGKKGFQELNKVIPSFVRRAEQSHKYQSSFTKFTEQMHAELQQLAHHHEDGLGKIQELSVQLIDYDPASPSKVAAALLFPHTDAPLLHLQDHCQKLPEEQLAAILDAGCSARENRRHKSPRALEHATFTFEICADFGIYRDLQRHRMLTQDRQLLTCDNGFFIPEEIEGTEMKKQYLDAIHQAKRGFDTIAAELPHEAQYVVPMAYNIRWYFHVNLRGLQWLCELRSAPAGHPSYRLVAQEMAKQVSRAIPAFERFFKFVDYDGYVLGRLGQEIRNEKKMEIKTAYERQ